MYHCHKRGRGVLDRAFKPSRIPFHKNCSYKRMVEKCKNEIYPDSQPGTHYYIADSTGAAICSASSESITVDTREGDEKTLPWCLATYLKLTNVRYQSKARFYCVEMPEGMLGVWSVDLTEQYNEVHY